MSRQRVVPQSTVVGIQKVVRSSARGRAVAIVAPHVIVIRHADHVRLHRGLLILLRLWCCCCSNNRVFSCEKASGRDEHRRIGGLVIYTKNKNQPCVHDIMWAMRVLCGFVWAAEATEYFGGLSRLPVLRSWDVVGRSGIMTDSPTCTMKDKESTNQLWKQLIVYLI